MTHLFVIRHGETDFNAEGRLQGSIDTDLNDKGIAQARQAADNLLGMGIEAIVSSPLKRASQTAAIIAEKLQLEVLYLPQFVERCLGFFEGMTYTEIGKNYKTELETWTRQYFSAPPGGESIFEVSLRVHNGLERIYSLYPEKTVLLVTHGYVGRIIHGIQNKLTDKAFYEFLPANGEIAEYIFD